MSKGSGYSVWLLPDRADPVFDLLQEVIERVANTYRTPVFPPHVTFLKNMPRSREASGIKLAKSLAPFEIELGELETRDHYFQRLFAKVQPEPTVAKAKLAAEEAFFARQGNYLHLSFAYGDQLPHEISHLKKFVEQALPGLVGTKFLVSALEIWNTFGTVDEWRHVATFPFSKTP